jgi:hydroxypyruvate isomerase
MNRSILKKDAQQAEKQGKPFNLNYAGRVGMFANHAGDNFLDQIRFMHDQGLRAVEDSRMLSRPPEEQEEIGALLARLGMQMGVFVVGRGIGNGLQEALVHGGMNWRASLATGKAEFMLEFQQTCRQAVDAAKRCNATWLTVIPGFYDRSLPLGVQTSNIIEAMKRGVEIFEPQGLVMVLESLSDTPEHFLQHTDQAYLVCKAVNSPACKILYDVYHMSRNEGNLIATMDRCWEEIAYIQIGDNPGRNEPATGEINYKNIFRFIYNKGYKGLLGMEHGNSIKGKEGEVALIKAYRKADRFIENNA